MKTGEMDYCQLSTLIRFYLDFTDHKDVNTCQDDEGICIFMGSTVPPNAEKHLFLKKGEKGGYLVGCKVEGEIDSFSQNLFVPFSDVLDNLYPLAEKYLIEKVEEAA